MVILLSVYVDCFLTISFFSVNYFFFLCFINFIIYLCCVYMYEHIIRNYGMLLEGSLMRSGGFIKYSNTL